jgi:hypothetical protein
VGSTALCRWRIRSGRADLAPDIYPSLDPDAWQPDDVLMAPLHSPDGELVGVLSVDLPEGGRKPGRDQCELLEMFAAQAAIAIDNARLHWALRRSVSELEREQQALRASEESFRLAFGSPSGRGGCARPPRAAVGQRCAEQPARLLGASCAGADWPRSPPGTRSAARRRDAAPDRGAVHPRRRVRVVGSVRNGCTTPPPPTSG